jgi:hypothetical protein
MNATETVTGSSEPLHRGDPVVPCVVARDDRQFARPGGGAPLDR